MFVGHYAVALAAKKVTPRTSLGLLFIAAQFLDLLWPLLIVLGVEQVRLTPTGNSFLKLDFVSYPYSHSLTGSILWAVVFGVVVYAFRRNLKEGLIIAGCVVSHWILDLFTHIPDLPLTFNGQAKAGFGLWNFPVATIVIETALFVGGIAVYLKATRSKDSIGIVAFWGLMAFLYAMYLASIFGPPPNDASLVGVLANLAWLFVLWAWWADKHRSAIVSGSMTHDV